MDQIIIAMSGRKQAGKNTLGQFICEHYAERRFVDGIVDGRLTKTISHGNPFLSETFQCSFADKLKEFCIDVLGLPKEACYGSDEHKNAPTQYAWEKVPDFYRWKFGSDLVAKDLVAHGTSPNEMMRTFFGCQRCWPCGIPMANRDKLKDGDMTSRDIMQLFGTDLIRQTFGNVWAKATIRSIQKAGKPLSVITDNRFPNEAHAVLNEPKGYVIRLTRSPFGLKDVHPSESALDDFDWNRERCFILDNAEMTIEEQSEAIKPILNEILRELL
jgi:hypothetical protein